MQILDTPLYNDASLVNYWRLEDTSDSKGTATLTATPSPVTYSAGKYINGANFPQDRELYDSTSNWGASGAWSVSLWFKTTLNDNQRIYSADTTSQGLQIQVYTGNIRAYTGNGNVLCDYACNYYDGNWHNIVFVVASTTSRFLYYDGRLVSSPAGTDNVSGSGTVIGSDFNINYPFNGMIDDVARFSRVLTSAEVLQIYSDGTIGNGQVTYLPTKDANREIYTTGLYNISNLTAYYRLSDTSDSKNSYTLTNNNSVPFSAGKFGNCADFGSNNTDKYFSVPNGVIPWGTANFSISMWVSVANNTASYSLLANAVPTYKGFRLLYIDGDLYFEKVGKILLSGGFRPSNNTWFHCVFTSSSTSGFSIYANGSLIANNANTEAFLDPDGQALVLGAQSYNGAIDLFLSGKIDDVGIFNRALTANEISALYYGGGTKGYYPLNGDSSNYTGNGYNLTAYNSPTLGATSGRFGGSVNCVRTSGQYLQYNGSVLGNAIDFTVSCWFKVSSNIGAGEFRGIFTERGNSGGSNRISLLHTDDSGEAILYLVDSSGGSSSMKYNISLTVGQWYHAAVTWDHANIYAYFNGEQISTTNLANLKDASYPTNIGCYYTPAPTDYGFNGNIDEVIVESRCWSKTEMAKYYSNSLGKFISN